MADQKEAFIEKDDTRDETTVVSAHRTSFSEVPEPAQDTTPGQIGNNSDVERRTSESELVNATSNETPMVDVSELFRS